MPTYFRTLTSEGHVRLWTSGRHTSFHNVVPGGWSRFWFSRQQDDPARYDRANYPLKSAEGVFTERAVTAFLRFAPHHAQLDTWHRLERKYCSELAGLCAFSAPREALDYGVNSVWGRLGAEYYVEFEGNEICPAPENNGVVVPLDRIVTNAMRRPEFTARHGL